jgi:uncharacterized UPF0160 family protein
LFELEAELGVTDETKPFYVVYPDETAGNWRVQAVPVSSDSFESRKALPEAWRGLRDEKLSEVSGIEGGIFVHASGFIGGRAALSRHFVDLDIDSRSPGNKTKDGALALARKALEL